MNIDSNRRRAFLLVLISFLALYFEIVLIRWIPGEIQSVGYFINLVLISTFLGLGIGFATPRRGKNNELSFLLRLFLLTGLCVGGSQLGISAPGEGWGEIFLTNLSTRNIPFFAAVIIIFIAIALTQIPMGRMVGSALDPLPPLWGYSLNLIGSVLGVCVMGFLRLFSVGPLGWFAIGMALYIPVVLSVFKRRLQAVALVLAMGTLTIVWLSASDEIWSPYYKISIFNVTLETSRFKVVLPESAGFSLCINNNFFQYALNMDRRYLDTIGKNRPDLKKYMEGIRALYQIPYDLYHPESVLILGAGTGNDVSLATRNNVEKIVAVEIDPIILKLGIEKHPMRPYQHPNVNLVVDDARHYLNASQEKFDMVVYGMLDSHRLVSSISTVRLESFVYTTEGLEAAAARLRPGGVIVLIHASLKGSPQRARLFQSFEKIFPGRTHALSWKDEFPFWDIFIGGPQFLSNDLVNSAGLVDVTESYRSYKPVKPATDDWPFLYLATESFFKTKYSGTLAALLLASIVLVNFAVPGARRNISMHFFLLGAGFLLLETKSIIDLSLLFGSTWLVSSIVIGSFLVMALLANLAVHLFDFQRVLPFYILLFTAIAFNAFFPIEWLLALGYHLRILLGGGFVALPVFFSGVIFAVSFKKVESPSAALGANVMGAVVGGFGEYASMFFGFHFLYFVVAIIYLGSWLFRSSRRA